MNSVGISVKEALPRFVNDDDFYLRIMQKFIEEREIIKVEECLAMQDYELAMNYAFDIKSLSGSLGLMRTYELACRLCVCLKEHKYEEAWQDISAIQDCYEKLNNLA